MLHIKDLNFSYKQQTILKDINMIVNQGQILALVGPNGSGKSTLLRCLNGFLQPDSGRVLLNGKNIQYKKRKWISRRIALLPQNLEAVQQITVYELVAMGRSPYQQFGWFLKENDKKSIEWAIDYMDLDLLRDRPLDKISGGERQRAWIAMILAQDTDIELAQKNAAENENELNNPVHFVGADVTALPFEDHFADLIISRGSLWFWKDQVKGLQEINRVLKVGGVAFGGGLGRYTPPTIRKRLQGKKRKMMEEKGESYIGMRDSTETSCYRQWR